MDPGMPWIEFDGISSFLLVLIGFALIPVVIAFVYFIRGLAYRSRREGQRPGMYAPRRGESVYHTNVQNRYAAKPAPRSRGEARGFTYAVSPASPYDAPPKIEFPAQDEESEAPQTQEEHSAYHPIAVEAGASFSHEELRRMVIAKEILQRRTVPLRR